MVNVYHLHPLAAGPLAGWEDAFARIAAMGFSHVCVAPPFEPGSGGDIFIHATFDRLHPALRFEGSAEQGIALAADLAARKGLRLMLDIAPGQIAVDSPLRQRQPDWFASPAEVATEWHRVASLPPARVWTYYIDPVHGLHLAADELERVVLERLDQFAATLADFWPAWSTFPPEAQQALLSIAWAVGVGTAGFGLTGPRWPHLHAAVVALDWRAAADAGVISATNNPGVIPRNKANAALFMQAAAAAS